jgi:hypothetical protein
MQTEDDSIPVSHSCVVEGLGQIVAEDDAGHGLCEHGVVEAHSDTLCVELAVEDALDVVCRELGEVEVIEDNELHTCRDLLQLICRSEVLHAVMHAQRLYQARLAAPCSTDKYDVMAAVDKIVLQERCTQREVLLDG